MPLAFQPFRGTRGLSNRKRDALDLGRLSHARTRWYQAAPSRVVRLFGRFGFTSSVPRHFAAPHWPGVSPDPFLASIAQRYELRLVPGHPVRPNPIFTLRTSHGLPMTLHRRP